MLDWEWLIGDAVIAALLPASYAGYRKPIVAGLRLFLSRLPAPDVAQILADQAALPVGASAEQRLVALAERCPALHKLGQILARDRRLAPELRHHLQRLESLPAVTPMAIIQQVLDSELGPLDRLGIVLEPAALAEASVAVVVPFQYNDHSRYDGGCRHDLPRRGVFKLLKPGIEERLHLELEILREVGCLLDDRCHAFGIPELAYRDVFDQVREKLATEIQLREEQRNLEQAALNYASEPEVCIPRLYPFCTSRVTAMERIDGQKVTEPGELDRWDRRRLAELIVEALIAGPIWSPAPRATFHADPHAGNLFATPEGRLAILDWSLTGNLGESERVAMTQLILGGLSLNSGQVRQGLLDLAADRQSQLDHEALNLVIADWLREVRKGTFPGFSWLMGMLDDAVLRARLRTSGDLILFRKSLLTLDGVLTDVSSDVRVDQLLPALFLRRLIGEWPQRLLASPLSRQFETRLSSEDIALLLVRLPSTPVRAWLENALELLVHPEACSTTAKP